MSTTKKYPRNLEKVEIPRSLLDEIDAKVVGKRGYNTRTSFIVDAVRRHLERFVEEASRTE